MSGFAAAKVPARTGGTAPGSARALARALIWVLAWALAPAAPLWSQLPAAAAVVSGTVLHGVTGAAVGATEVALLVPGDDGQLTEAGRTVAAADGRFGFGDTPLPAGQSFVLVAFHRGVPYPTSTLQAGQQSGVLLEVYDPGRSPEQIRITGHNYFIAADESGLDVAVLLQLANDGETAYVGQGAGAERHVLEFHLPEGLINLRNYNSALHQVAAGRYFDTQPLAPGEAQISFSFRVPAESFEGEYVHRVDYPTESLDFYLQPPTIEGPTGGAAGFEDLGVVRVHERQYRHLRQRDLPPGREVRLPLPVQRPKRWMIKWAAVALGLIAAAAALWVGRGAAATTPGRVQLQARRRALLAQLAAWTATLRGRVATKRRGARP